MIKANISGLTDKSLLGFDFSEGKKIINKILKIVSKKNKVRGKHYISYIFIDNEEIHRINKNYRNIDRPTDVISFAMIDDDDLYNKKVGPFPEELGDVFISYEKIIEQAKKYGHSIKREFAFLVTHGILHLLGYDHIEEEDEKEMFAYQEEILTKIKILRS